MKRKKQQPTRGWQYLILVVWLIAVDQLTKLMVRVMTPDIYIGILSLHLTTNTGAIFGYFKGMNSVFILLSFIVIGVLIYHFRELSHKNWAPMAMVLAGVLGNLIDRLLLGHVIDFIDFRIWPVFNIADSAVTISVVFLIILLWKK